jgi:hypothetical protein
VIPFEAYPSVASSYFVQDLLPINVCIAMAARPIKSQHCTQLQRILQKNGAEHVDIAPSGSTRE